MKRMKLPRDLEAKRDEFYGQEGPLGFMAGAQAVLCHEMIKKLEEATQKGADLLANIHMYPGKTGKAGEVSETLWNVLAEFRAWKNSESKTAEYIIP